MNERSYKFLISSASNFTGEYESDLCKITHAWDFNRDQLSKSAPEYQKYLVIELSIDDNDEFVRMIEELNLSYNIGKAYANILSAFYGKVIYFHGAFEADNLYLVPNIETRNTKYKIMDPFNSNKRKFRNIELKLSELNRIDGLMNFRFNDSNKKEIRKILSLVKQYSFSLQQANYEPDIAYLSLVECGEIYSNMIDVNIDDLLTCEEKDFIDEIKNLENGEEKYKVIKSCFRKIKRKYIYALKSSLGEDFYSDKKTMHFYFNKDNIENAIANSYDLRSLYIHAGGDIGSVVMPNRPLMYDYSNGFTNGHSKAMKKLLKRAATYSGLERIIYYCILSYLIEFEYRQ